MFYKMILKVETTGSISMGILMGLQCRTKKKGTTWWWFGKTLPRSPLKCLLQQALTIFLLQPLGLGIHGVLSLKLWFPEDVLN